MTEPNANPAPSPATFEELVQILAEADPQRTGPRPLPHHPPPPRPPMRYLDLWVEETGWVKVYHVPAHPLLLEEIQRRAGNFMSQTDPTASYAETVVFVAISVIQQYPAHPHP